MIDKDPMSKTLELHSQESRKLDHIELALKAQSNVHDVDTRFYYEPLMSAHPSSDFDLSCHFLDKKLLSPLWISSMTGGVGPARHINQNLARLCHEFGLGMGLGSCRVLLESDRYFEDFNLRPIIGHDLPFFANLGIAQVERLVMSNNLNKISDLLLKLEVDGLIVHINPLQEWFQPEGDRLIQSPLKTLTAVCARLKTKIIVKEVGQGMGPLSLKALLDLPIAAIDLAAFGGTNFALLEMLRNKSLDKDHTSGLSNVGHSCSEMISILNNLSAGSVNYHKREIIISGGIDNMLDGYYLRQSLKMPSVIGQARSFLTHAETYSDLKKHAEIQIEELKIATAYLSLKRQGHQL